MQQSHASSTTTGLGPSPTTGYGWPVDLSLGSYPGVASRLIRSQPTRETRGAYERLDGYSALGATADQLLAGVEASGLRGRGGGAFPTGAKLRSVADRPGPRFVVANGEEGEPTSVKDRWLLRARPHLVLDGLFLAARSVGATRAYIYMSDPESAASVHSALAELDPVPLPTDVVKVAPRYVAGEETAAIRAIGGGEPLPVDKPPRPFEAGVNGRPTLVLNVETLANLPAIAAGGADRFRDAGTTSSPGTFLCTISGDCAAPGLYDVPLGVPLRDLLERCAGFDEPARAFLIGGFFGGVLGPRIAPLRLGYDELRAEGSGLGCGAIVVLGAHECPVGAAADVLAYLELENAKQCGPCIKGTAAMRDAVAAVKVGAAGAPRLVERLRAWSLSLVGRGACGLLDGAARIVSSLLREFPEEIDPHLAGECARCLQTPVDPHRFGLNLDPDRGRK